MIPHLQRLKPLFISIFFAGLFFFIASAVKDPDTYYHIKLGEIISQQGLLYHDVLSQAAPNRPWMPFEWLFQVSIFQFIRLLGISSLPYFVGIFALFQSVLVYLIVTSVFKLRWYWGVGFVLSFAFLNYDSFTARPQLWAMICFLIQITLILTYIKGKKNLLWLSLLVTYVLSTFHITVIFIPVLLFLFGAAKKDSTLLAWSLASAAVSVLPPTGMLQYRHAWLALQQHEIFQQNNELQPLWMFPLDFFVYTLLGILAAIPAMIAIVRSENYRRHEWPLLCFFLGLILFGFTALRNTDYGHIGMLLLGAWGSSKYLHLPNKKLLYYLAAGFIGVLLLQGFILSLRLKNAPSHLPENAANFLLSHQIPGNIFHMDTYGGYFAYRLYPKYHIFIDGRADVYYDHELSAYLRLVTNIQTLDAQFRTVLNSVLNEYNITTAIITYRDNPLGKRILDTLRFDDTWEYIFWDDYEVIFIKQTPQTKILYESLAMRSARPFGSVSYRIGKEPEALKEFMQMDDQYPSALSKNNIGFILFKLGKFEDARKYFSTAIKIDPEFYFAYSNLALIELQNKNYDNAIRILEDALTKTPNKLRIYQILGAVYQQSGNPVKARQIWTKGLSLTKSEEDKRVFMTLIKGVEK